MGGENAGTRFRLFPQAPFLHPERPPEIVVIASPPGLIGPGPSDDRLYVVEPVHKAQPYGIVPGPLGTPFFSLPPWRGPIREPARPGPDGHFDHIPVDSHQFAQAHLFGAIRFVLEVWERYLGHRIEWHVARDFERLEVVILPSLRNAHVGYGYMESGTIPQPDGSVADFALNFDVIAHEIGHLIIYSELGIPARSVEQKEYFGFQESAADSAALIAVLHFESMIEQLLADTHGNLYGMNELNRFAELSAADQIRIASNSVKLSEFARGWDDEHDLSQPLTGAIFDILVDIFQEILVERGLIGRDLAMLSDQLLDHPEHEPVVQSAFSAAYRYRYQEFRAALLDARDYLGFALAETWKRLPARFLDYEDVGNVLLAVDNAMSGGRYRQEIWESFDWREIGRVHVGPRLTPPDASSHAFSDRTLGPEVRRQLPKMCYRERMLLNAQK